MFEFNTVMLNEIKARLKGYPNIYWVIGGSCAGKSTLCKAIAEDKKVSVYDMDAYVYGHYGAKYTMGRHPAIMTWFSAENSLAWIMALSEGEFDAFNKVTNVEFLDLFAKDMAERDPDDVLLVDGGITHPSVLAAVLPPERILCIDIDPAVGRKIWNEDPERAAMKAEVSALAEGEAAWGKFLRFDAMITERMLAESEALNIKTVKRTRKELGKIVSYYFGF